MKIKLDQEHPIELEFGDGTLQAAANIIECQQRVLGVDAPRVFDALFTILLFRKLEQQKPGTLSNLMVACRSARGT